MPTREHESPLALIEEDPPLAARLLHWAGGPVMSPHAEFRLESADLSEFDPTEYRADRVVGVYADADGHPGCGVIVESQRRYDEGKFWSWPAYVANFRARKRCEGYLVVLCYDEKVAERCRVRIPLGNPGSYLYVLVVGPKEIPLITDPDEVQDPLDAVLSTLVHAAGPHGRDVAEAMIDALARLVPDGDQRKTDIDNVTALQSDAVRNMLEELMVTRDTEPKTQLFKDWKDEGKGEGDAEASRRHLLALLDARGLRIDDARREAVNDCVDPERLETWFQRALTASSVDEVFAE
ncbi:hypothetical protein [Actinomadura oligospora]|uniref:hypothetical protein n=1 Tax=Actinomadura oligospora TaxID=111804 RepID=UPI0012FB9F60|nr:hypothetical protein [Actinomadura oligospora]